MLFGAHVSAAGGISKAIDRVEEIGGNAVQVFTQSPRMWKPTAHAPEEIARFRERRRAGAREVGLVPRALPRQPREPRRGRPRRTRSTALRATMETADAIGAEAVVFHVGSHLGLRLRRRGRARRARAARAARAHDGRPLALHGERRRRGRDDRPLDRRARGARRRRRPPSAARRLPRLVPLVGLRRRRLRPGRARRTRSPISTRGSASTASACST